MVDLFDKNILETISERTAQESESALKDKHLPFFISFEELKNNLKYNVTEAVVEDRLERLEAAGFLRSKGSNWQLTFKGKMILEDFWNTLSQLKIVEEVKEVPPEFIEEPGVTEEKPSGPEAPLTSTELTKSLDSLGLKRKQAVDFLSELKKSYQTGLIDEDLYVSFRERFSEKLEELEYEVEEELKLNRAAKLDEVQSIKQTFQELPASDEITRTEMLYGRLGLLFTRPVLFFATGLMLLLTGYLLIAEVFLGESIFFLGFSAWIICFSIAIVLTVITGINISMRRTEKENLLE